jgi:hypothetical protein
VGRDQLRPRGPTGRSREVLAANARKQHERAQPRERRCVSKPQVGRLGEEPDGLVLLIGGLSLEWGG